MCFVPGSYMSSVYISYQATTQLPTAFFVSEHVFISQDGTPATDLYMCLWVRGMHHNPQVFSGCVMCTRRLHTCLSVHVWGVGDSSTPKHSYSTACGASLVLVWQVSKRRTNAMSQSAFNLGRVMKKFVHNLLLICGSTFQRERCLSHDPRCQ